MDDVTDVFGKWIVRALPFLVLATSFSFLYFFWHSSSFSGVMDGFPFN
jgi:hypothetical protein